MHYAHILGLVLRMIHGISLELLVGDARLPGDLLQLILDDHLLFVGHLLDYFSVFICVVFDLTPLF